MSKRDLIDPEELLELERAQLGEDIAINKDRGGMGKLFGQSRGLYFVEVRGKTRGLSGAQCTLEYGIGNSKPKLTFDVTALQRFVVEAEGLNMTFRCVQRAGYPNVSDDTATVSAYPVRSWTPNDVTVESDLVTTPAPPEAGPVTVVPVGDIPEGTTSYELVLPNRSAATGDDLIVVFLDAQNNVIDQDVFELPGSGPLVGNVPPYAAKASVINLNAVSLMVGFTWVISL